MASSRRRRKIRSGGLIDAAHKELPALRRTRYRARGLRFALLLSAGFRRLAGRNIFGFDAESEVLAFRLPDRKVPALRARLAGESPLPLIAATIACSASSGTPFLCSSLSRASICLPNA